MRRMVLLVTGALLVAAMIAAGAMPTFAKQAKTKEKGRAVSAGTCTVPSSSYSKIQDAVRDPSCQTIQLTAESDPFAYQGPVIINRNLTIQGSTPVLIAAVISGESGKSVFTILPGNTVTLEYLDIGGAANVEQGGGIHNQGTLVLKGGTVRGNNATAVGGMGGGIYNAGILTLNGTNVSSNVAAKEGGGIYNAGTLYLCGATVSGNEAPPGTENDISGTPAQQCPTGPPVVGEPQKGKRVLVKHQGKKELCLPQAALKAHLDHGDRVIDENGCSKESAAQKDGNKARGSARGAH